MQGPCRPWTETSPASAAPRCCLQLAIDNKRQFREVNPEVLDPFDPIFYGDLRQAALKALGLN